MKTREIPPCAHAAISEAIAMQTTANHTNAHSRTTDGGSTHTCKHARQAAHGNGPYRPSASAASRESPTSMRRESLCVERTTNGGQWLALAAAAGPLRRAQRDEQRGLAARVDDLVLDRSLDRHLARVVAHELVATQTAVTPSRRRRPILICHAIAAGCRRAQPRRISITDDEEDERRRRVVLILPEDLSRAPTRCGAGFDFARVVSLACADGGGCFWFTSLSFSRGFRIIRG